jgi:hypothetical protein
LQPLPLKVGRSGICRGRRLLTSDWKRTIHPAEPTWIQSSRKDRPWLDIGNEKEAIDMLLKKLFQVSD